MTTTPSPGAGAEFRLATSGSSPFPERARRRRAIVVATVLVVATVGVVMAVMVDRSKGDGPGIANPAAVFCEQHGGTVSGPEPMCRLPDGTTVDAWEYFRQQSTTVP